MARPTRIQIVQMAALAIVICVALTVATGLVVFWISVAMGAWTDRPR